MLNSHINATPLTKVMQRYQWLKNMSKDKENTLLDSYLSNVDPNYKSKLKQSVQMKIIGIVNNESAIIVEQFFWKILDILVVGEIQHNSNIQSLLFNSDFIQSLLAVSIYTHQAINNKQVKV